MPRVPLTVDDLRVTYATRTGPVEAVRGVSFTIAPGEIFGLVGESGSGKSSVLGALIGLLPSAAHARAASIRFGDAEISGYSDADFRPLRGRQIALVPQQPMTALSPTTPVGGQLAWYFGDRVGTPPLHATLRALGLDAVVDRLGDLPSQFSGGQLQRLVLAIAAYAHEPSLVLADEPTTTLDPTVQAQVLDLLLEVQRDRGFSMLYVSHDLGVIARVCDRVGVLLGGELVEVGTVDDLFDAPAHPYTRALLAAGAAT